MPETRDFEQQRRRELVLRVQRLQILDVQIAAAMLAHQQAIARLDDWKDRDRRGGRVS